MVTATDGGSTDATSPATGVVAGEQTTQSASTEYSVAIDGDTMVIGKSVNTGAGSAEVWVRSGATWASQQVLTAVNGDANDVFGYSVAISGNTIVIGAYGEDSNGTDGDNSVTNSGAAYVFTRSGTTWSQQAYLKAPVPAAGDFFGRSVGIDGDTVVVGADSEDTGGTNSGAAYVFTRSGSTWSVPTVLKSNPPVAGAFFGQKLAISGNTVVVSAVGENTAVGAVYVFVLGDGGWTQQARLLGVGAIPATNGSTFGSSVAISGDTVVVGQANERSTATGVNGAGSLSAIGGLGAAYIFTRSGSAWTQQAFLKAPTPSINGDDRFGGSVAISGDQVAIGAPGRQTDTANVTVNGPDNSSGSRTGAVYLFERLGGSWSQTEFLTGSNAPTQLTDYGLAMDGNTVIAPAQFSGRWYAFVTVPYPAAATAPSITGSGTLTVAPGTWAAGTPTFSYQWMRCNANGVNCVDIDGATANSRTATAEDVGNTLRVKVYADVTSGAPMATTAAFLVSSNTGGSPGSAGGSQSSTETAESTAPAASPTTAGTTQTPTTTPAPSISVPGSVVGVRLARITRSGAVVLRWAPPSADGGAPVTGYRVQYRKSGTTKWKSVPGQATKPTVRVTGLKPNSRYRFKIAAVNARGQGPWRPLRMSVKLPAG